jgi:hypothetical protein
MTAGTLAFICAVTISFATTSTVSAEEGEFMGASSVKVIEGVEQSVPGGDGSVMFGPSSSQTAASASISVDKNIVNTVWNEEAGTWVNENDPVTVSWSADLSGGTYIVFYSSSDGINFEGFASDTASSGAFTFGTVGLGCFQIAARVTDANGNFVSGPSNYIEVCSKDSSTDFTFYDVFNTPVEYTFYNQIENLAGDDIVGGFEDGFFRPNYPVTRAQMSKFIRRAYFGGETDTSCGAFPDVSSDNPFYTEVTTLKCKGVISGYEDGNFQPNWYVTRAEATKFVMFGLREREGDMGYLAYKGTDQAFTDVPPSYAFYEVIMAASTNGIVGGYEDGTFLPDIQTTRGVMSKMVDNARNK